MLVGFQLLFVFYLFFGLQLWFLGFVLFQLWLFGFDFVFGFNCGLLVFGFRHGFLLVELVSNGRAFVAQTYVSE